VSGSDDGQAWRLGRVGVPPSAASADGRRLGRASSGSQGQLLSGCRSCWRSRRATAPLCPSLDPRAARQALAEVAFFEGELPRPAARPLRERVDAGGAGEEWPGDSARCVRPSRSTDRRAAEGCQASDDGRPGGTCGCGAPGRDDIRLPGRSREACLLAPRRRSAGGIRPQRAVALGAADRWLVEAGAEATADGRASPARGACSATARPTQRCARPGFGTPTGSWPRCRTVPRATGTPVRSRSNGENQLAISDSFLLRRLLYRTELERRGFARPRLASTASTGRPVF
jgi:hypothetical protein